MPRVNTIQTNFTAGELSPRVMGRVDIARYQNGAEQLRNVIPDIYGGARRAPGTRMIARAKYGDRPLRLIPFVFSEEIAYSLEFGDGYMRVFLQGAGQVLVGGVPYEIATPYGVDLLREIRFVQRKDTMFLCDGVHPMHTLRRLAHDHWVMAPAAFSVVPFEEVGDALPAALTLSDNTVGAGRTVTASASIFVDADVGREITHVAGAATITAVTGPASATVDITAEFPSTVLPAGQWVLEGSPQAELKPSAKGEIGQEITLAFPSSDTPSYGPTLAVVGASWASGEVTVVTGSSHGISPGQNVQMRDNSPAAYNGTFAVSSTPTSSSLTYAMPTDPGLADTLGTVRTVANSTTAVNGWRASDVGKFVRINRGLVQITAVDSGSSARGIVKQALDSDVAAPADAWVLEGPVWSDAFGYPKAVTINGQRLVAGGTTRFPNGVWGSRTGLYFDFTKGDADTDGFFFDLDSDQVNIIQHLAGLRLVVPLSYGGESTLDGGVEKPITPTNVRAKDQSVYGCSRVKPVRVGNELLFVQRAGRKVRAMAYRVESDSYAAPDLTLLSEHIMRSGIVDMAWAQEPSSVLWVVLGNGEMGSLTLDREEGVMAWAPHDTDGQYETVCAVPGAEGDAVWLGVHRVVNGEDVRYIEYMDGALHTHSGVIASDQSGAETWAGLDHLEGKTVEVVADGAYKGSHVVTGGEITIDRPAFQVEIGLKVRPVIALLRPELATPTGTAQGSQMSTHETMVLFLDTVGAWINGEEVPFRQFGPDILDQAPQPFSGFKGIGMTGWYTGESPITITQEQPMPFHVLSVIRKWTTNG